MDWAQPFLDSPGKLYRIMDPLLRGKYSCKGAQLTASVVRRCLQHKPKNRPLMSEVVSALEPVFQMHDMAG